MTITTALFALLGQALLGWLLADFIGGILHWWQDRVGRPTTPWFNKHFLEPNDLHHADPMAFTENGFWERNWTTFLAAGVVASIWWFFFGASWVLFFALLGGALTNQIHYLQHTKQDGWIKVLQETGIIQGPRQHNRHHKPPQDRFYCPLTDWINPILEQVGFWVKLEKLLRIKPREPLIT